MFVAWGSGGSWNLSNIVPTASLRPTQIACASPNSQMLVVYRDTGSTLRSRDRLSGWAETAVPNGANSFGNGLFITPVSDSGRSKFALFAVMGNNTIMMSVWDDAASPKWSQPTFLDPVPGGTSLGNDNHLTGYGVSIGPSATQGLVSVFVVSNDGHLRENKGPLTGTRSWIDHGSAPGNKQFSPVFGFGPTATAIYNSTVGHPGSYVESEYARRILIPTSDQTEVFARVAVNSTTSRGSRLRTRQRTPRLPSASPAEWPGDAPVLLWASPA
jgi:hypothetical protein